MRHLALLVPLLIVSPLQALAADEAPSDDLVVLSDDAPVAHFETTVIGTRSERKVDEVTAAAEIVDRREIEASGARDLGDLLAMKANVTVETGQWGQQVRLQGLDPDHVLVLVDGQRLGGRKAGGIDLRRIPLDSVARVEIVRGPASALYGSDAMGGVIHVVTRRVGRPFEADGELRYGEGNLLELSGSAGSRGQAGLLRVTAGHRRRDPWRLDPMARATTGSGIQESHALVRGEAPLGDGLKIDGTASWMLRDSSGIDAGAGGAIYDRTTRLETLSLSLRPQIELGGGSTLRLTAEGNWVTDQFLQDQRGADDLDSYDELGEQLWNVGLQADLRLGSHLLVVGTEALLERMQSQRFESGEGSRDRLGFYVQDEWRVAENLQVAPGVRLDLQDGMDPQPAPRMAVRWDVVQPLILRASYGMAWRAPSFQELLQRFENIGVGYVVEGNPELRPETSHGGTLGAEWKATRALRLHVELFRQEVDDLIAVATVRQASAGAPRTFGYVNVDRALSQGVESRVDLRVVRGFDLQFGHAFTDARDRDSGERLEGRAPHRLSAAAIWRSFDYGTDASIRLAWVSERPHLGADDRMVDAPAYADLSVHVRQEVSAGVSLLAGGTNLLDAGSVEFLPIAPRTIFGGVSFRY